MKGKNLNVRKMYQVLYDISFSNNVTLENLLEIGLSHAEMSSRVGELRTMEKADKIDNIIIVKYEVEI